MIKRKFIKFDESIHYPTTKNIQRNLPVIKKMAVLLKFECVDYEYVYLWCRGSSGAIIAALIAEEIPNSQIVFVQKDVKDNAPHHSHHDYLYNNRNSINVFVDDFITEGHTLNAVVNSAIESGYKIHAVCVSDSVSKKLLPKGLNFIICSHLQT